MINYLEVSRIITVISSLAITFGLYDQTLKIWRTKSVKDFTPTLLGALIFSEVAWLNYGLVLKEWPIILLSSLNLPSALLAAVGYWRFRHKENLP